jgi:SnoaL-like domain
MTTSAVVDQFWTGMNAHDWTVVGSTIADDFVRIGPLGTDADVTRGKDKYLEFCEAVSGRAHHHACAVSATYVADDGHAAVSAWEESLQMTASDDMYRGNLVGILEIDGNGLISRFDIYMKAPDLDLSGRTPDSV